MNSKYVVTKPWLYLSEYDNIFHYYEFEYNSMNNTYRNEGELLTYRIIGDHTFIADFRKGNIKDHKIILSSIIKEYNSTI